MPKQRVDLRLDGELLSWARAYAGERRWTLTTVVEAALEALRGDAAGGVPDPSTVARAGEQPERSVPAPRVSDAWLRQQKLNDAKYGRKR